MRNDAPSVRSAQVSAPTAAEAVQRFHAAVSQPDTALLVFFCSNRFPLAEISAQLQQHFGDTLIVGCTSVGQLGSQGYASDSIAGASFPAESFAAVSQRIDGLDELDLTRCPAIVQGMLHELAKRAPGASAENTFAFLMIDSAPMREEWTSHALQSALGRIPLVGGSAGDRLEKGRTGVYGEGSFGTRCAVLTLVSTPHPFLPMLTQHFEASDKRLVITAADTAQRIVHEIDGRPAADAYAQQIGVTRAELSPAHFIEHPLAVVIGGANYVRSAGEVLPDGGLRFFCAIDEGLVLRVVHGTDMAANLARAFAGLRARIGTPQIVLGCDCVFRRHEAGRTGAAAQIGELLRANNVCGFDTYGEQYLGVHVNHTFTGIAIGRQQDERHGG